MSILGNIINAIRFSKRITIPRIINSIKLRISYFISTKTKKYVHSGYPESISIEPTTACNLKCIECLIGAGKLDRPAGKITLKTFDKVIDEIGKYTFHLNLYFQGEPFLHPDIFKLIEKAHQKNIYVTISTNGHFLNEKSTENIITSKLDKIIISVDGITQETYEKYRKGGNLETVLEGLKLLSTTRSKKPYIEVQFIAFKHNEHEIPQLRNFFAPFNISKLSVKNAFVEDFVNNKDLIPEQTRYSRYSKDDTNVFKLKRKHTNACWRSWHSAVITWDGELLPCCFDKNASYSFGNIQKDNVKAVWKNMKSRKFRGQILKNRDAIEICSNCVEGVKYKA